MSNSSNAIEQSVEDDFILLLTAAGITRAYREGDKVAEANVSFPAVSVGAAAVPDPAMHTDNVVSGFYRVDVILDPQTHVDDDKDQAAIHALAKQVRDAVNIDDFVAVMNALSTYVTYYGLMNGPPAWGSEGDMRHGALSYTAMIAPISGNTTTTTTTTTTTSTTTA